MSIQTELAVLSLSETLCSARLKCGDSQAVAAQRAGVSLRSYQRMESKTPEETGRVALGDVLMALGMYGVNIVQAITASTTKAGSQASYTMAARKYGHTPHTLPEAFNVNRKHLHVTSSGANVKPIGLNVNRQH